MINPIETYQHSGRAAAQAMNHQDASRHQFERYHFNRMVALENDADKPAARVAYEAAYKAARTKFGR